MARARAEGVIPVQWDVQTRHDSVSLKRERQDARFSKQTYLPVFPARTSWGKGDLIHCFVKTRSRQESPPQTSHFFRLFPKKGINCLCARKHQKWHLGTHRGFVSRAISVSSSTKSATYPRCWSRWLITDSPKCRHKLKRTCIFSSVSLPARLLGAIFTWNYCCRAFVNVTLYFFAPGNGCSRRGGGFCVLKRALECPTYIAPSNKTSLGLHVRLVSFSQLGWAFRKTFAPDLGSVGGGGGQKGRACLKDGSTNVL